MIVDIEKYTTTGVSLAIVGINRGDKGWQCEEHRENCGWHVMMFDVFFFNVLFIFRAKKIYYLLGTGLNISPNWVS